MTVARKRGVGRRRLAGLLAAAAIALVLAILRATDTSLPFDLGVPGTARRLLAAMHREDWETAVAQLSWSTDGGTSRGEGTRYREVWGDGWRLESRMPSPFGPDHPPSAIYRVHGRDGKVREVRFDFVPSGLISDVWVGRRRAFSAKPQPTPRQEEGARLPAEAPEP